MNFRAASPVKNDNESEFWFSSNYAFSRLSHCGGVDHVQGRICGRGWGRLADVPPQGFDPLPTQRVSPLYFFEIFIFG